MINPTPFLRELFEAAVKAADPMRTIPIALPAKPKGRVVVIGAGKASARMAEAVEAEWGACEGMVITRYGYERPCKGIEIVSAAHPVPDAAGEAATKRMLKLVSGLGADDFVLCLISGGGSALLTAPVSGVTLGEKQAVNEALLASGAPIGQMNILRKHLSLVKGGQLAAAAYPAKMLCLMISDVPGDNPADIASGPTVGADPDTTDARAMIEKFDIELPTSVTAALKSKSCVIPVDDPQLKHVENRIISAPSQSLKAAQDIAEGFGVDVRSLGDDLEGEARDVAALQIKMAKEIQSSMGQGSKPVLLLSGGECTVTRRGDGIGGPNAEFTLAAILALEGCRGIDVLACDTDGVDGAAEVAGAIANAETILKATAQGISAKAALANNNAHGFFASVDAQIVTGPTLTNVNDFRAILIQFAGKE